MPSPRSGSARVRRVGRREYPPTGGRERDDSRLSVFTAEGSGHAIPRTAKEAKYPARMPYGTAVHRGFSVAEESHRSIVRKSHTELERADISAAFEFEILPTPDLHYGVTCGAFIAPERYTLTARTYARAAASTTSWLSPRPAYSFPSNST